MRWEPRHWSNFKRVCAACSTCLRLSPSRRSMTSTLPSERRSPLARPAITLAIFRAAARSTGRRCRRSCWRPPHADSMATRVRLAACVTPSRAIRQPRRLTAREPTTSPGSYATPSTPRCVSRDEPTPPPPSHSGKGESGRGKGLTWKICLNAVHAEGERKLATVVQVVFHDMIDDPCARQVDDLAVPVILEGLLHILVVPARQAGGHHIPGEVERPRQFLPCARGRILRVPLCDCLYLVVPLAQHEGEPAGAAADDVCRVLPHGAQARRGAQR